MTIDFSGKVALVTGAGRGLGRAYALELARRGARVVVNDIGVSIKGDGFSKGPADEVVTQINAAGGEAVANYDDIGSPDAGRAVAQAVETFGTIDILINNAGNLDHHPFAQIPDATFVATQNVHLLGTFRASQAAYAVMCANGTGRIVMTTSQVGFFGKAGSVSYSAAKMGIAGLLSTLSLEAPQHGVHVNAIAPFAGTRMSAKAFPEQVMPLISPERVSAAVMFLCSDLCTTSGNIIVAGGGHFSAAMTVETSGIDFDDVEAITAETIAERFTEITDTTRTHRFKDAMEAVGATFERILDSTK
jgi:NAD(P)-dependent dehydrogenase (short-subunit alcohol dehydrogenase family)